MRGWCCDTSWGHQDFLYSARKGSRARRPGGFEHATTRRRLRRPSCGAAQPRRGAQPHGRGTKGSGRRPRPPPPRRNAHTHRAVCELRTSKLQIQNEAFFKMDDENGPRWRAGRRGRRRRRVRSLPEQNALLHRGACNLRTNKLPITNLQRVRTRAPPHPSPHGSVVRSSSVRPAGNGLNKKSTSGPPFFGRVFPSSPTPARYSTSTAAVYGSARGSVAALERNFG